MKKLLLSIMALGLTTTGAVSVVSCGDQTHNRDFNKTNLQIYSNSDFSHIGILGAEETPESLKTKQDIFEWNIARAFENDIHLPIVADDFEFTYFNEFNEVKTPEEKDFEIGATVIFKVKAKDKSANFESETQVIKTVLIQDVKKELKNVILQTNLKSFAADKNEPQKIYDMIKRFNNNVISNERNLEIVNVIAATENDPGQIIVKGAETSFNYNSDSEVTLTFTN